MANTTETNTKMKCKNTGEIFIIGTEFIGGHPWGDERNYQYRAMSMNGYLSEANDQDKELLIKKVNAIEEVDLEEV